MEPRSVRSSHSYIVRLDTALTLSVEHCNSMFCELGLDRC